MVPDFTELTLRDVKIKYRNFAGKPNTFGSTERNFAVVLPEEVAKQLAADGWNVKERPGREEGDPPSFHLPVAVGYKVSRKPKVVLVGSKGQTPLGEDLVELADMVNIDFCRMIIRARHWTNPKGDTGVKAWLQSLYIHIIEDELELEYAEVPMADGSVVRMPVDDGPSEEPPF